MKTSAFLLPLLLLLALSCKKKEPAGQTDPPVSSGTTTTTTGNAPSQTSVATITLTSGAKTTTITGTCGWATAAGVHYIGASDQHNSFRVFNASFNITDPPAQTTTYTLVAYDMNDTDPTHANINVSEQIGNGIREWNSSSGTLTLVVNGNKITADLAGITLQAQTNSGFLTNLNTGDYASPGVLSGSLSFYK